MKVGIDIGGSHMAIGLINNENEIVERYEKDYTSEEKKDIIPAIEGHIVEIVKDLKDRNIEIEKIGIAVPGSTKNGVIKKAINLGIQNYDIAESIKNKIGIPVQVINDAKSACKAEYNHIKNDNIKNMLFLAIGTGIGGGMIYNGELMSGTEFDGCELGHMVIKKDGIPCKCGKKRLL